jgi:hypothetical protein
VSISIFVFHIVQYREHRGKHLAKYPCGDEGVDQITP